MKYTLKLLIGLAIISLNIFPSGINKEQKRQNLLKYQSSPSLPVTSTQKSQYRITRCLGREELRIHRDNHENYFFSLNQALLIRLLSIEGATISDSIFYSVCKPNKKHPSIDLFLAFLKNGKNSFKILKNKNSSTESSIQNFISGLPEVMDIFFLNTKKEAPDMKCLRKFVPELLAIEEDLLYLLGTSKFNTIINKNGRFKRLVSKIRDPYYFQKNCPRKKQEQKK